MLSGGGGFVDSNKIDGQQMQTGYSGNNDRPAENYQESGANRPYEINPIKTLMTIWNVPKGQHS